MPIFFKIDPLNQEEQRRGISKAIARALYDWDLHYFDKDRCQFSKWSYERGAAVDYLHDFFTSDYREISASALYVETPFLSVSIVSDIAVLETLFVRTYLVKDLERILDSYCRRIFEQDSTISRFVVPFNNFCPTETSSGFTITTRHKDRTKPITQSTTLTSSSSG